MPKGGRLTVRTENIVLDEKDLSDGRPSTGEFVRLQIQDTGEGIARDVRAQIFEPFFTTKGPDKGSGLGLALVKNIAEQNGGWIECQSEAGQGACFDLYLPRFNNEIKLPGE